MKKTMTLFAIILFVGANSVIAQMQVKDTDANVLLSFNDEGDVGSITLPSAATAPLVVLYKLYTVNDSLFFNGNPLGLWKQMGNNIYYSSGNVGIGTMAPQGLFEIHTPADSNPSFYLSDGDVAHGATSQAPTNVFGHLTADSPKLGGLLVYGFSDAAAKEALTLMGTIGSTNPNDNVAAVHIIGTKKLAGPHLAELGATETILGIANRNNPPAFVVLGSGNVGIGTTTPGAKLEVAGQVKITGGNPGANKVLTSDGSGLASWQAAAGGGASDKISEGNTEAEVVDTNGDGHFKVTTEGTERLRVDNSGKVGIGTTTPSEMLEVRVAPQNYAILASDGTREGGIFLSSNSNSVEMGSKSNHRLDFFTNDGGPQFSLLQNGKVGIGTTTPSEMLEVRVAPQNYAILASDGTREGGIFLSSNSNSVEMGSKSNHRLDFFTNDGGPQLSLLQNGNVGIGTTNTIFDLEINRTNSKTSLGIFSGGANWGEAQIRFNTNGSTNDWLIYMDDNSLDDLGDADRLGFFYSGVGTVLSLDGDNGNVGIGTNNPTSKLQVEGNVDINSDLDVDGGTLHVDGTNDNVGIGTATPTVGAKLEVAGQIKITGGTPVAGEVLTSDGTGLATWEPAPAASGITKGTTAVSNPVDFDSQTTIAHGLGTTPDYVKVELECLVAQHGYAVGDIIAVSAAMTDDSQLDGDGIQIHYDSTNLTMQIADTVVILDKSAAPLAVFLGGVLVADTAANWKVTATPYKF